MDWLPVRHLDQDLDVQSIILKLQTFVEKGLLDSGGSNGREEYNGFEGQRLKPLLWECLLFLISSTKVAQKFLPFVKSVLTIILHEVKW